MFQMVRGLFRRRREDDVIATLIRPPRILFEGFDDPAKREADRRRDPAEWRGYRQPGLQVDRPDGDAA